MERLIYVLAMICNFHYSCAIWTLTGSSNYAVLGENFTLICNPGVSDVVGILWRRLDLDTKGTHRAVVETDQCKIESGSDTDYQYTCSPGPIYYLMIPSSKMTEDQHNKVWRCEPLFGGSKAEFTLNISVAVKQLRVQGEDEYQETRVIFENKPKSFTCITNGCRPRANVWFELSGVNNGGMKLTYEEDQSKDLIVTTAIQKISTSRGNITKTLKCLASNIPGRQNITSEIVLDVYYSPSTDPIIDYTSGTIMYLVTGNETRSLTCTLGNSYPVASLSFNCAGKLGSEVGTSTEARSNILLPVTKFLNGQTCTCKATHPVNNFSRSTAVTLIVYYAPDGAHVIEGYSSGNILYETSNTLSLICKLDGGNPVANLTWSCLNQNGQDISDTSVAKSKVELAVNKTMNQQICTCIATSRDPTFVFKQTTSVTFTVYYAPSVDAILTGYSDGTVLYEGDRNIRLTCQQSGGNPISNITWTCLDNKGKVSSTKNMAKSTVDLNVSRDLDGKTCTCNIQHPDANVGYRKSKIVTFSVYYPPSLPKIVPLDGNTIWIEKENCSLKCETTAGNPKETAHHWKINGIIWKNVTTEILSLVSLQAFHNGLKIQCGVDNTYTIRKPTTLVSDTFILNIEYAPVIDIQETKVTAIEGSTLKLNCQADGNPTPFVRWYKGNIPYTEESETTEELVFLPINRSHAGEFICKAYSTSTKIANLTFSTQETVSITVYYPPDDNLTIEGYTNGTVLYETDGILELTCRLPGGNPLSQLTWSCNNQSGTYIANNSVAISKLKLNINRMLDKQLCSCTARINVSGMMFAKTESVAFTVYYKPSSDLIHTGYVSGSILYEGDKGIALTCQQKGGNPLADIVWDCMGESGTVTSTDALSKSVVILQVNRSLHGMFCTCFAVQTDQKLDYNVSKTFSFAVYYPPATPSLKSSSTFPWLENGTGVLTCVTSPGNPRTVTYKWIQNGKVVPGETGSSLTINPLHGNHNGVKMQCQVSNNYTEYKRTNEVSNVLVLNVEHTPVIMLDTTEILIEEGSSINKQCSAIGNPMPSVKWYRQGKDLKASGSENSAMLSINNIPRNATDNYTCKATSEIQRKGLTLQAAKTISISVHYMKIETGKEILSCHNSETIKITCSASGSANKFKFYNWTHTVGETTVRSLKGYMEEGSTNSLLIEYCGYFDTGYYTCRVSDGIKGMNIPSTYSKTVEVEVLAPPVISLKTAIDRENKNEVKLVVVYFSVPTPHKRQWLKAGKILPFSDKFQTRTISSKMPLHFYGQTVDVKAMQTYLMILNPSQNDYGIYTFRIENVKGTANIDIDFQPEETPQNLTGVIAGAVGGSLLLIIVILGVVIFMFCQRRRRRGEGTHPEMRKTKGKNEKVVIKKHTSLVLEEEAHTYEGLRVANVNVTGPKPEPEQKHDQLVVKEEPKPVKEENTLKPPDQRESAVSHKSNIYEDVQTYEMLAADAAEPKQDIYDAIKET